MVAALFLLLRPLCDVWAASDVHVETVVVAQSAAGEHTHGVDSHEGAPCCASVDDGALAKPSEAGALLIGTHPQSTSAALGWAPAIYGGVSVPAIRTPSGAPPPALSYYARSARIQR